MTAHEPLADCDRRFGELTKRLDQLDAVTRLHDRSLASLEAKVATFALLGSVVGGGLVTAIARWIR